jgi:hypothetical protein
MEQDQLQVKIVLLLQKRKHLSELARASQDRETNLFQEWQEHPEDTVKYRLREQQKQTSKDAIAELERAQTEYLETCRKLRN